jgi:hypothetical protein
MAAACAAVDASVRSAAAVAVRSRRAAFTVSMMALNEALSSDV